MCLFFVRLNRRSLEKTLIHEKIRWKFCNSVYAMLSAEIRSSEKALCSIKISNKDVEYRKT